MLEAGDLESIMKYGMEVTCNGLGAELQLPEANGTLGDMTFFAENNA